MTRTILCDVDGTLIDSNYLHTIAWSRAFRAAGAWAPMNAIHRLVGMGAEPLVQTLRGHAAPEINDGWRREYDQLIDEALPFPRAGELLRSIADRDSNVVLATSSPQAHLERLVPLLDADAAIRAATTADDVHEAKPSPEIFLVALARVDGDPSDACVLGDSVWDIEAANAARLPCVALETGGFSRAELLDAGAAEVHEDIDSLLEVLDTSLIGIRSDR